MRVDTSMKRVHGFTLIELMLVVAIIGILSAVAVNMYTDNVIASNRTEARSALQQAAATLEKCRSLYGGYSNAPPCNYTDFTSESGYYDIAISNLSDSTFTLTATPGAGSRQVGDDECTSLTLTNTGAKSGTGNNPDECW